MNAYFFTGAITQSQMRPAPIGRGQMVDQMVTWDNILSHIFCADTLEGAQALFKDLFSRPQPGENPIRTEFRRIVGTQLIDKLLTETSAEPVDWSNISARIEGTFFAQEEADQAEGYWADVNQLVPPSPMAGDIEALRRALPEDVRSGLNWETGRQHFFLISSLAPSVLPPEPRYEMESEMPHTRIEDLSEPAEVEPGEGSMPVLRDKTTAALVQARNAVVAGWLWRRFARTTPYATYDIDMEPACTIGTPNPAT